MTAQRAVNEDVSTAEHTSFYLPAMANPDDGIVRRALGKMFRRRGSLGWHRRDDRD